MASIDCVGVDGLADDSCVAMSACNCGKVRVSCPVDRGRVTTGFDEGLEMGVAVFTVVETGLGVVVGFVTTVVVGVA